MASAVLYSVEQQDLSTLALRAGLQIDNIIRSRQFDPEYIQELARRLSGESIERYVHDPSTVVVMRLAYDEAKGKKAASATEAIDGAGKMGKMLASVLTDPASNSNDLVTLRSFCYALSRSIADNEDRGDEDWGY